jgi:Domain of unknown function (DUF4394)
MKQITKTEEKQRSSSKARVAAALVGLVLGLGSVVPAKAAGVCPAMPDVSIYALDTTNTLYKRSPGGQTWDTLGKVTGIGAENLVGMDFRPADGQLYAVGDRNTIFRVRLDAISPDGVPADTISKLQTSFASIFGGGWQSLMDFNPVVDAIRLIGSNRSNYAVTSANGGLFNQLTRQTDMNIVSTIPIKGSPNITAGAYDNNYLGATNTTFYMIDHDNDNFAMVPLAAPGNPNSSSNTAGGVVSSFGAIFDPSAPNALTPPINFTAVAGLDVYTDQTVDSFPNFVVATTGSSLYCIGVQIPPAPTGVVSYDLNTLKRQVAFSKRIVATPAGVKDLPGVTFADVAVVP